MVATTDAVMEALKQVIDPELFVNAVDLGLVYGAEVDGEGNVKVTMSLTSHGCPIGPMVGEMVQDAVGPLDNVKYRAWAEGGQLLRSWSTGNRDTASGRDIR